MPGEDFAESLQIALGEVGDLPYLPELPDRGVTAAMTGRTLAMISDLGADLQPAGWRLTDAPGIDHRRATSLLAQDLDALEEVAQGRQAAFKVQITGPWTLAATVERPRGDKVLGDHGARRDLAQALAEGAAGHVADVRRRVTPTQLIVQIDEPALPAVLAGAIPTASGFNRHRSVIPADAAQALTWMVEAVEAADATTVLHCCASDIPWNVLRETKLAGVSFDLTQLAPSDIDELAAWVDAGREAWPGVVPAVEPDPWPTGADLTRRLLTWWSNLGHSDIERLPATTVTPSCGLAGASPRWARTALELAAQVARNLSAEQGKMEP